MAKHRPDQPGGSDHGHEYDPDRDDDHKFENDKGNASHIEIEERRFRGGLTPTPELYANARDQWNQLPGSVVRSPMDPVGGNPPEGSETKPAEPPAESDDKK
jgi:hypothetical protein